MLAAPTQQSERPRREQALRVFLLEEEVLVLNVIIAAGTDIREQISQRFRADSWVVTGDNEKSCFWIAQSLQVFNGLW